MMTTSGPEANDLAYEKTRARDPRAGGRSERFTAVRRVLELDRKIKKDRLLELAGVRSQSSFKRIKRELKQAGMPLTYDSSDECYHVPPEASIARYGIDPRARAQLAQLRAAVSALGGVAAEALEDFLEVLDARIALDDPAAVAVFTSRHPQPRGGSEFYATLDRALSAVREHRWLSYDYKPTAGGERSARTIAPHAVHSHDGRYYVWGTLEGDATAFPSPRLFALDQGSDVVIEDDTFTIDKSPQHPSDRSHLLARRLRTHLRPARDPRRTRTRNPRSKKPAKRLAPHRRMRNAVYAIRALRVSHA